MQVTLYLNNKAKSKNEKKGVRMRGTNKKEREKTPQKDK